MPSPVFQAFLVDQNANRLSQWAQWLGEAGFEVDQAEDQSRAVQSIEQNCPHVLVIGHGTGIDALSVCRWLRKHQLPNYVYVVVVSDNVSTAHALRAGADSLLPENTDKGNFLAWIGTSRRVIDLERRLSKLAKHDPLTGLPSQRTMSELMEREWGRALRYQLPLTCAMIDLDFFKRVNDTYGHSVGDQVLKAVAGVLQKDCRTSDAVSRYGGEEFCVLLPETTEESALIWAERVREDIAALSVVHNDKSLRVTASIGVAARLEDTESPAQLIDLADQSLLIAKQSGRDRVVSFTTIDKPDGAKSATHHGPGVVFRGLRAKDVMTTIVAGLSEDDEVWSAAQFFQQFRITSAPVIDATGKLVGILSEKDLMSIMIWPDWRLTKICDVMKTNVVCYDENAPVLAIYEFLCRVSIRSVVVTNDGKPTGIMSRTSLLHWVSNSEVASEHHELGDVESLDEVEAHQRLSATVFDLIRQAKIVEQNMDRDTREFVPCVVGGASRIQELANDLLALAGAINRRKPSAGLEAEPGQPSPFKADAEQVTDTGNLANFLADHSQLGEQINQP